MREAVETYRFNDAAQALYHFTWHEFCDWYIEQAKIPLTGSNQDDARKTSLVLRHVLDAIMRLLHPFIPFISEEIASKIPMNNSTLMRGPFPIFDASRIDSEAEQNMDILMGLISSVRNIRAEMNIAPSKLLPVIVFASTVNERNLMEANQGMITSLARVSRMDLTLSDAGQEPPRNCATAVVGEMRIFVPLEGIVDPDAEIERLEKELARIRKEFETVQKKLSNENFLAKANPDAVQKQKDKQAELFAKLSGLGEGLTKMRALKN